MFAAVPDAGPEAPPPQAVRTAAEIKIRAIRAFGLADFTVGTVLSISKITLDGMSQVLFPLVVVRGLIPPSPKNKNCGGD